MKTLPDYLRPGLRVVSIGLNPSIRSAQAGYYFANPRNRFWAALAASRLAPADLVPGPAAMAFLHRHAGMGFTDVVKRPTRGGAALRAEDFRRGAPVLREKLAHHRPGLAWFHGKQAYRGYLRYAEDERGDVPWGLQPTRTAGVAVFVTPNPSPANAVYSLDDLVGWYSRLAAILGSPAREF